MAPPKTPGGPKDPAADTAKQVDAMRALSDAVANVSKSFETLNNVISSSDSGIQSLLNSAKSYVEAADDNADSQTKLNSLIKQGTKATNVSSQSIKELTKNLISNSRALTSMVAAWKGFAATLKGFKAIAGGVFSAMSSIAGAIIEIGAAIISAPFKMLDALVDRAKEAMNGGTELAEAYEAVREVFGDISKGTSKDIIDLGRTLATSMIAPGLRGYQVFGNLAEAIQEVNKLAAAAPAAFQQLSTQFENSGMQILAMSKGLGIAEEELVSLQQRAIATGEPLTNTLTEITKYAKGMGAQFGLSSKVISRDMGRAMKDVKHFANVTVKEIAQATVYAHKLGLELKDITGILDAFNTFDEAAENVAKLSQAFGVNIDTMKLLEAKTPTEALEEVKRAFTAAGKSADQMNRQELQLIAQTTGMSEEVIKQSLSMKNAGVSMDAVKSASAGLAAQTMDTGQAVASLAADMKRLVKQGQSPEGRSFFEIFLEGFTKGIDLSGDFQKVIRNVMKDMWIFREAGFQVGQAFVKFFPGIKDFFDGLTKLLDPTKIKSLMNNVVETFTKFFKGLENGTATVEDLIKGLQTGFFKFFDENQGGRQLLAGLKKIWKAVERIVSTGIDWLSDQLKKGLQFIDDLLSGKFTTEMSAAGNKLQNSLAGGIVATEQSPIVQSLIKAFEKLKEPLTKVLEKIFELAWQAIKDVVAKYPWQTALIFLGPTFANIIAQAFLAPVVKAAADKLMSGIGSTLSKMLGSSIPTAATAAPGATTAAGGSTLGITTKIGPQLTKALGTAAAVAGIAVAAVDVSNAIEKFGDHLQEKGFDPTSSKIAAGSAGLINTLTFGLLPDDLQQRIAESIAGWQDSLFKAVDKYFGPGFSDSMKRSMSGFFDVFGGLGDLLKSMWKGDSEGVNKALEKIAMGLYDTMMGQIERIGNLILKAGPKLLVGITALLEWLSNKISTILTSLTKIPIIGSFIKPIADAFKLLEKFFGTSKELWTKISEFVKEVNFTEIFRKAEDEIIELFTGNKIEENFQKSWDNIKNIVSGAMGSIVQKFENVKSAIAEWSTKTYEKISKPFNDTLNWLKVNFDFENFKKLGENMLNGILTYIEKLPEKMKEKAREAYNEFKDVFKISSPSKAMEYVGKMISEGMLIGTNPINNELPNAFEKVKENIIGIFDKGEFSKSFSTITEAFNEETNKLTDSGSFSSVSSIIDEINNFTSSEKFKQLPDIVDKFVSVEESYGKIADTIATISDHVVTMAAVDISATIKSMVDAMSDLNKSLDNIKIGEGGEINVKLNKLAKGITRADQKYQIQKGQVNINLQLQVHMSVSDIESMMVKNPSSLIRARINDLAKDKKQELNEGATQFVTAGPA